MITEKDVRNQMGALKTLNRRTNLRGLKREYFENWKTTVGRIAQNHIGNKRGIRLNEIKTDDLKETTDFLMKAIPQQVYYDVCGQDKYSPWKLTAMGNAVVVYIPWTSINTLEKLMFGPDKEENEAFYKQIKQLKNTEYRTLQYFYLARLYNENITQKKMENFGITEEEISELLIDGIIERAFDYYRMSDDSFLNLFEKLQLNR